MYTSGVKKNILTHIYLLLKQIRNSKIISDITEVFGVRLRTILSLKQIILLVTGPPDALCTNRQTPPIFNSLLYIVVNFFTRCVKSWTDARFGITQFVMSNTHVSRHLGVWSRKQKKII